jgi:hypothetical protein
MLLDQLSARSMLHLMVRLAQPQSHELGLHRLVYHPQHLIGQGRSICVIAPMVTRKRPLIVTESVRKSEGSRVSPGKDRD